LDYEYLTSIKGQVVADFIVEYRIDDTPELDMSYLTITPWTLYFDGSVCNEGQGISIVLVLLRNATFDFSSRLKAHCTNNQVEYEALLFGLELLNYMRVTHVKVFDDSQLVVRQILGKYQCLDGMINDYLERCWDKVRSFDEFDIRHISRVENSRANSLAQEASSYRIPRWKFHISKNLIFRGALSSQVANRLALSYGLFEIASDHLTLGRRPSDASLDITLISLVNDTTDIVDWRMPLITYLCDRSVKIDRGIWRMAFKYVLIDNELYR
jgi:ribonuclease HI